MSRLRRPLRTLQALPAPVRWLAAPAALLACTGAVLLSDGTYQPPLTAPTPDAKAAALCRTLMGALPPDLLGRSRTTPSPYVAVWPTKPRTVLRCGVPRPKSLDQHQGDLGPNIDGVQWYLEGDGHGGHRFTLTLHALYVEVAAPAGATPYPTDALAAVSPAVLATIPDLSGELGDQQDQ
ncbi:DUF3515 family protein [Kitasatospora azatica]|uniref:DUF3515 family protein n=1 Tax=Kitasatospora azatica TaxID=58347 RepID=UPI00068AAB2E|nr:DUF3515 family protein [Kitasatospora azatica]